MRVNQRTRYLACAGMLAALSSVLMFLEFPLPLLPPFLKLDFSDIPVLIGAFVLGPIPAVGIALVKDVVHISGSSSGGVGELADFIASAVMALVVGYIYKYIKSRLAPVIGSVCGIIIMTAAAALANLYILMPFYAKLMPIDAIFAMCAKVNPVIVDMKTYILYGNIPFNLIKGVIVTVVSLAVFKQVERFLKSGRPFKSKAQLPEQSPKKADA